MTTTTTTTTELLLGANSHLFDSERALYPDDDLATTVWTPRAFSASDSMVMEAGGLDCALSATAEQSEPRTPFAWCDFERTLREGETQVRFIYHIIYHLSHLSHLSHITYHHIILSS
jgi:hypothetical protein